MVIYIFIATLASQEKRKRQKQQENEKRREAERKVVDEANRLERLQVR